MKNRILKSLLLIPVLLLAGCWDDDLFPGGGKVVPVTLQINAVDAVSKEPEVGATVELYHTLAGYVNEVGAVATKVTDAEGKVIFTKEELGDVGQKYFNVISGNKRNWASVSNTAVLNMTSGNTTLTTLMAAPLPQFLALAGNRFKMQSYMYPPADCGGPDPCNAATGCYADDEFLFLKTGRVMAYDAGVACGTHFKGYTAAGVDYSAWSLNTTGTTITIRDLDPFYNTANPVANRNLTISGDGNTVTIDFGSGYIATITKL